MGEPPVDDTCQCPCCEGTGIIASHSPTSCQRRMDVIVLHNNRHLARLRRLTKVVASEMYLEQEASGICAGHEEEITRLRKCLHDVEAALLKSKLPGGTLHRIPVEVDYSELQQCASDLAVSINMARGIIRKALT